MSASPRLRPARRAGPNARDRPSTGLTGFGDFIRYPISEFAAAVVIQRIGFANQRLCASVGRAAHFTIIDGVCAGGAR